MHARHLLFNRVPMRARHLLGVAVLAACNAGPTGPLDRQVWVLESVNGQPLPASPHSFSYPIVADTLEFDVQSSEWKPTPLARASRWYRIISEHTDVMHQDVWYTYDPTGVSPFTVRVLCADGDLADCIDGSGTGTVDGAMLELRFRAEDMFGRLRYRRIH